MANGNIRLIISLSVALAFLGQSLQVAAGWCTMPDQAPVAAATASSSPCHGEDDNSVSPADAPAGTPMDCCDTDNCAMTGCMSSPTAFVALEPGFAAAFSHVYHASNPETRLSALPSPLFRPPNLR